MLSDDLAQILVEDLIGTLAPSGNIWVDFSPPLPDDVFVISSTGGSEAVRVIDSPEPIIERSNAQVLARSASRTTAATNITTAYDALRVVLGRWVNGTRYLEIVPLQSPFYLGKDENERWIYVFNVRADRAR